MKDREKIKEELLREITELHLEKTQPGTVVPGVEHKQNRESPEMSRQILDMVFDTAPTCIKLITKDGSLQKINRAGLDMLEADSLDQVKDFCISPLLSEEYREAFNTLMQKVFEGESRSLEFKMIGLKGRPLWLFTHVVPLRNEEGKIILALATTVNITERKLTEDALRNSEARIMSILRAAPAGIGVVVNRVLVEVNSRICEMVDRNRNELIDKSARVLYPTEEDFDFVGREKYRQIAAHGIGNVETRWIRKDGSILNVLLSSSPINPQDLSAGVTFTAIDITERKLAEKKLQDSEERYRLLTETSPNAITAADISGKILMANKRAVALYGHAKADEVLGRNILEWVPPDEQEKVSTAFSHVLSGGVVTDFEVRLKKDNNEFFWASVNASLAHEHAGQALFVIIVTTDITGRKQAEETLRESRERLKLSLEAAHAGSWEWDMATNKAIWSHENFKILGLTPEASEASYDAWLSCVHPDDREDVIRKMSAVLQNQDKLDMEFRVVHPDGTIRWINDRGEFILDEMGKAVKMRGIQIDITERKQTEIKLSNSEQFIRNILDTVDEGFIVIDRDFRIQTANKAYCSQSGMICDDVIGSHCYEVSHKRLRPCYEEGEDCAVRRVFDTGEPHTALHKHKDRKGSILYIETKAFPIKDSTGRVTSVIETVNNITEKHLLEEERLKTQKLEAIGLLAGGIAHDFNNLLQGIFGYISMAKMTLSDKDQSLSMLEEAEKALHLSVNLTSQLLTFSKGGKPLKKIISLRPVIENSVKFSLSGSRVDYRILLDDDLWTVEADAGQIGQVIQNIVLNADQAMPLGGTIVITAKNVRIAKREHPQLLREGEYAVISVKDSGIGISEQYLQKIFDPYFTTKEKGSGLGLATSYSIVRNHGGVINVNSKVGKGSTFYVYLPALVAEKETASPVPEVVTVGHKGKILLMDDEELIRNIAGELLKVLEHTVDLAENGEEAIGKYQSAMEAGKPFDIVILDLTIRGGMGGKEAIERLIAIDPGIRAIVSSGYSGDAVVADYEKYGFKACLNKPYRIEDLKVTLNKLLSE